MGGSDKKSSRSKSKDAKSDSKSRASSKSKDPKPDKKDKDKKTSSRSKSKTPDDTKSVKSAKSAKSSKSKDKSKDKDSKKASKKDKSQAEETKDQLVADVVTGGLPSEAAGGFNASGPFVKGTQPTAATVQKQCALHGKDLQYYCENTESLICYDCTVMGPHNTQLHRISKMDEAFSYRFQTLNKAIHESLVPKRTQLIGQIVRLDTRLDEVKSVRQVIERDIRNEYAGVVERLKSAEGVKTAVLSHDLAEVQQDITRIDEILMFMEEISSAGQEGSPDQVAFLHHYRQLNENIEYAVTKQFKVDIDVYPNDLPRELAERQLLIEHYEEQRRLLKMKDDIIWKMSQELKKKYDFYQDEFDKETRNEMEEWAKLVDRYAGELKKYDLVCAFCGQHLSDLTANTDCIENNSMFDSYTYFTEEEPAQHIIHKGRHWFGHPSMRQMGGNQSMHSQQAHPFSNVSVDARADQVLAEHQSHAPLFKKLVQQLSPKAMNQIQMSARSKEDLVNSLFEAIDPRAVKPAEIFTFCGLFTDTTFREAMSVLQRFQIAQTPRSAHGGANVEATLKVKEAIDQTPSGLYGLEQALRTFSGKHGAVNQDQVLIALTRVDAGGISIDDVKDFFSSVKGDNNRHSDEVDIDEILNVLNA